MTQIRKKGLHESLRMKKKGYDKQANKQVDLKTRCWFHEYTSWALPSSLVSYLQNMRDYMQIVIGVGVKDPVTNKNGRGYIWWSYGPFCVAGRTG